MWSFEHTVESTATPEAVWALYADTAGWPAWDTGIEACEIDGPFEAGTTGRLAPVGVGMLPFTITWAEPGRGFTDETPFEGHVLRFLHTLTPLDGGGTRITHGVEIEGPAAEHIGPGVTSDLPEAMEALAALAASVAAGSPTA